MFYYYFSDNKKQDYSTTNSHNKNLIEPLKEQKILTPTLSKRWENTHGCAEKYRCASALYLMSFLSQCFSIIIDKGIISPGNGKDVVNGINTIDKRYIYQFMSNVKLPGSKTFD